MATRHPTAGMAHPTVVPENFTPDSPDDGGEDEDEDGGTERVA